MRLTVAVAVLLLSGCGGHAGPDDSAFHAAVTAGQSGAEVNFDGVVQGEPVRSGSHEHLVVLAATGERLEIDHNTDLAPWVPAHSGDRVVVRGQLYIDPGPRLGVHCTHARTSRGCPAPGWVEAAGTYYE